MSIKLSSFYTSYVNLYEEKREKIKLLIKSIDDRELEKLEGIKSEIESIEIKMTETRENFISIYTEMRNYFSEAVSKHKDLKAENETVDIKVISDFLNITEEKIRGCNISTILDLLRPGNDDESAFSKFEEYNLELKEVIDDVITKKEILENFKDKIEQYEKKKTENTLKLNEGREDLLISEEGMEGGISDHFSELEINNLTNCYTVVESDITKIETDFTEWLNTLEDKSEGEITEEDEIDENFNQIISGLDYSNENLKEIENLKSNISEYHEIQEKILKNLRIMKDEEEYQEGGNDE